MIEESHPLEPFLPHNGQILFLGSFPPPRSRWSMEFFYPNFINDFWRVMGIIHFGDPQHFVVPQEKRFDKESIIQFCRKKGLAFFDTATRVRRLKDNASDDHLEIVEPTDIAALLSPMPGCGRIVTTGGLASQQFLLQLTSSSDIPRREDLRLPSIGTCCAFRAYGRDLEWWRMPSTSRAYPLKLEKKAELYQTLF